MIHGRTAFTAGMIAAAVLLGWLLFFALPEWYGPKPAATPAKAPPAPLGRKINARLFYVAESGTRLTSVEREVPYGEGTAEQARAILTAQLEAATAPDVSAVPPSTSLRALFVTDRGEMFVDFSPELAAAHAGGSLNELLTIYTIVNAVTVNLPTVNAVQILVDGKEVDTLAGHVDLRRPLMKNLSWVE